MTKVDNPKDFSKHKTSCPSVAMDDFFKPASEAPFEFDHVEVDWTKGPAILFIKSYKSKEKSY